MSSKTAFSKKDVIVIVLCGIFLVATLGSVGSRGRRRAKEAVCLSNLRQWGNVFLAYAEDNDGYIPGYGQEPEHWWPIVLLPYYGQPNLRLCPEAVRPRSEGASADSVFSAWGIYNICDWWWAEMDGHPCELYGSYGKNEWAGNIEDAGYENLFWRRVPVNGGSNVPLLLGCNFLGGFPQHLDEPPAYEGQWNIIDNHMGRFCMNRHSGFVNSAFLDGSARKVGLKELWTLKWHREYDTCGPWTTCGGMQPSYWPVWMRDFQDY
jgi:prepilin-type processing-associated H-X9-DG protein